MRIAESRLRKIIRQVIKESSSNDLSKDMQVESKDVNELYKILAGYVKDQYENAILTLSRETKTSPEKFILAYLGFLNTPEKKEKFKKNLKGRVLETFKNLKPDEYVTNSDGRLKKK